MSLFDKLRRKLGSSPADAPPPVTAEPALFEQLAGAVADGDEAELAALCRAHADAIVAAFPSWRRVDQELEPAQLQRIVEVLGRTAKVLADELGRPEPWAALTGAGDDSPFARWEAAQRAILQRVEVLDYAGAVAQADALLADLDDYGGPARDQHEELIRGLRGQLLRQVGRPEDAAVELQWTFGRSLAHGDDEAVGVYLEALYECDRDRGRPSPVWAIELAEHYEGSGDPERVAEAAWLREVQRRYPDGEPLLRMIILVDGRRHELDGADELLRAGCSIQVVFERSRQTLAPALRWTERGREHGGAGELDDAIACFVAAAEADPHDPECRNLHAFTLMLMDRPDLALPLYEEVERLAPGWFHARTWRSLARRQLAGELPHECVLVIHTLQDGELDPDDKLSLANQALTRWPRVPELHLFRGEALAELGRDPQHAWLAGLEVCDEVPSTRSRLLLALGRVDEVVEIDGANLMAAAAATLQRRVRG